MACREGEERRGRYINTPHSNLTVTVHSGQVSEFPKISEFPKHFESCAHCCKRVVNRSMDIPTEFGIFKPEIINKTESLGRNFSQKF